MRAVGLASVPLALTLVLAWAGGALAFVPHPALPRAQPPAAAARSTPLNMVMDGLMTRLDGALQSIGGTRKITEAAVDDTLKDVRRALLDSDVNLQVTDSIIEGVKQRSIGTEVTAGVTAQQQLIKNMYDELLVIMGNGSVPLAANPMGEDPTVVLMAGLQGAGKTTSAAKLALACTQARDDAGKPTRGAVLAACDIYRPAAIKQLQLLGEKIGVEVFTLGQNVSAVDIATQAVARARELQAETGLPHTLIVDTAGRQVIDGPLMQELADVKTAVQPDETLLVVDAMTGQEAATLTARFNDDIGITGAILTKLDGDTQGGAALSVRAVSGCPIKFVGMGETMVPLEPFYPERLASRILGQGDVVSLVEKAQEKLSEREAADIFNKIQSARFDFDDFLKQAKMVQSMGSMSNMMSMIPGMAGQVSKKQMMEAERKLKYQEIIIAAMTDEERGNPDLLIRDADSSERIERIAEASARDVSDVENFIGEFQQMRTMMMRMSKQMPGAGDGPGDDPFDASGGPALSGNRAARRAAKKAKKSRPSAGGFGRK